MVAHSSDWKATINCYKRLFRAADVGKKQGSHAGNLIDHGAGREAEAPRLKGSPSGDYEAQQPRPASLHLSAEALHTLVSLGLLYPSAFGLDIQARPSPRCDKFVTQ